MTVFPVYWEYGHNFSMCDHFNRNVRYRKYPFRHGDRGCEVGSELKMAFAITCFLENTLNVYRSARQEKVGEAKKFDFQADCYQLAQELYDYALTLP